MSGIADSTRVAAARLLALLAAITLSACTVGLVPAYDAQLAEGLGEAHSKSMVLFASVETGVAAETFPEHADAYAEVIGAFGELKSRAQTRPMPPLAKRLAKSAVFQRVCPATDNPEVCLNVTPESLDVVLSTLRVMRNTHRDSGLTPALVDGFQRQYVTAVNQALTIEAALKR